jgi:hypothetical protein
MIVRLKVIFLCSLIISAIGGCGSKENESSALIQNICKKIDKIYGGGMEGNKFDNYDFLANIRIDFGKLLLLNPDDADIKNARNALADYEAAYKQYELANSRFDYSLAVQLQKKMSQSEERINAYCVFIEFGERPIL